MGIYRGRLVFVVIFAASRHGNEYKVDVILIALKMSLKLVYLIFNK